MTGLRTKEKLYVVSRGKGKGNEPEPEEEVLPERGQTVDEVVMRVRRGCV